MVIITIITIIVVLANGWNRTEAGDASFLFFVVCVYVGVHGCTCVCVRVCVYAHVCSWMTTLVGVSFSGTQSTSF